MIGADIPDPYLGFFDFLHQPVVIHDSQFSHAAKTACGRPQPDPVMDALRQLGFGDCHVLTRGSLQKLRVFAL